MSAHPSPPSSPHGCCERRSSDAELRSRTSAVEPGWGSRGMRVERPAAGACGGVRGAGAARGRPPPLDVLDLNSGIGAGDRVWTTRAGTLAAGARSRSTSTNFSSAATGSGASSSASSSDACSSSGDAGGPGSSFSSSKSSGLSSNASAAAEMASGSRAPRRCTTLFGPSISTRPASGTLARYVFHSTAPSSPSNTAPPRRSSSSSSTTSILVLRPFDPTLDFRPRNGGDIRDVAATTTTATIAPMTTSTAVRAVSLAWTSCVSSGKSPRAAADAREMTARRAPTPAASADLVLDQTALAATSLASATPARASLHARRMESSAGAT